MDNNPTATPPTVDPTPTPPPVTSLSKKWVILVVGLVTIGLAVGGFYLYSARQQAVTKSQITGQDELTALEKDINSVIISDGESEFSEVDKNLQDL